METAKMRKAIVLTAYNRPDYFKEVLDSWSQVRGRESWDLHISIDPSERTAEMGDIVWKYQRDNPQVFAVNRTKNLGVLKHPVRALSDVFLKGYDFVVRAEDDLVVSDDILEYFDWASDEFAAQEAVKTVHAYSFAGSEASESTVRIATKFNPWVFGTWRDRWEDLKSEWDQDYSTYNGTPMNESGFDWNFDTRVYPTKKWFGVFPDKSRVNNIGEWGVHGTPWNLPKTPSFQASNEPLGGRFDLQL